MKIRSIKIKSVKRRMTTKRRYELVRGIASVVNGLSIEGIYGLPDYQIANIMVNLFFEDMRRQKKLGGLK